MSEEQFTENYDSCDTPICHNETTVRITGYDKIICINNNIYVSWVIDNKNDIPRQNQLLWSLNNNSFSNSNSSITISEPYYCAFNADSTGVIYFKIKANINETFYESDVYTISVVDDICDEINYIVPAKVCDCLPGIPRGEEILNSLNPSIWVKEEGVPKIYNNEEIILPIYFSYQDDCYYIDKESLSRKILYNNQDYVILSSIEDKYENCDECCS